MVKWLKKKEKHETNTSVVGEAHKKGRCVAHVELIWILWVYRGIACELSDSSDMRDFATDFLEEMNRRGEETDKGEDYIW